MKTMTALAAFASVAIAASTASFGANLEVTRDLTLGRRVTSYATRDAKEIAKLLAMLP